MVHCSPEAAIALRAQAIRAPRLALPAGHVPRLTYAFYLLGQLLELGAASQCNTHDALSVFRISTLNLPGSATLACNDTACDECAACVANAASDQSVLRRTCWPPVANGQCEESDYDELMREVVLDELDMRSVPPTAACTVCLMLQGAGPACFPGGAESTISSADCSEADWPMLIDVGPDEANQTRKCAMCIAMQTGRFERSRDDDMNEIAACFPAGTVSSGQCRHEDYLAIADGDNRTAPSATCGRCVFLAILESPSDNWNRSRAMLECAVLPTESTPVAIVGESTQDVFGEDWARVAIMSASVATVLIGIAVFGGIRRMQRKMNAGAIFVSQGDTSRMLPYNDVPFDIGFQDVSMTLSNPILPIMATVVGLPHQNGGGAAGKEQWTHDGEGTMVLRR